MKGAKSWLTYRQLNSSKPKAICRAAKKLGKLKESRAVLQLIGLLRHADDRVRTAVADALGEIGDEQAITPLVVALQDQDEACFQAARDALRKFGKPAVTQLVAMSRADEDRLRAGVMATLGRMNDASSVDHLIGGLTDRAPNVRAAAAEALGHTKDERAVMPLVTVLEDERKECRQAAQDALVAFGSLASRPLVDMLEHDNQIMRESAIRTLGALKDFSAVGPLSVLAEDSIPNIRKAATIAMGRIGEPSVTGKLREYLDDEDRDFRNEAFEALEELSRSAVSDRDWSIVRRCGGAAVRPVVEALFTQLEEMKEKGGTDPAALLWVDDAFDAIVEIAETKSVPFLLKLIEEPQVSGQVLVALEKWLKRSAFEFTDEQLRELGALDEVVSVIPELDGTGSVTEKKCDCSAVNHLAKQALGERSQGETTSPPEAKSTVEAPPPEPPPVELKANKKHEPAPDTATVTNQPRRLRIHDDVEIEVPDDAAVCGLCGRPTYSRGSAKVVLADDRLDDMAFIRRMQKALYLFERFDCSSCEKVFCWQCAVKHVHEAGAPSPGDGMEWCPGCASKVAVAAHRDKAERVLAKEERKAVVQMLAEVDVDAMTPDATAFEVGKRLAASGWSGLDAYFGRLFAWQVAKLIAQKKATVKDLLARIA